MTLTIDVFNNKLTRKKTQMIQKKVQANQIVYRCRWLDNGEEKRKLHVRRMHWL